MGTKEEKLIMLDWETALEREQTRKRREIISLSLGIASLIVSMLTLAVAIIAFTRA